MPAEGRKISQLTPASSIADTDLIPKENATGTSTEAATAAQLAEYFRGKGVQIDETLSTPGAAADAAKTGAEVTDLKNALNYDKQATPGYILRATDDGNGSSWEAIGTPTDEQVQEVVNAWMDNHSGSYIIPDGNVTTEKLHDEAVTNDKLAADVKKPWYKIGDLSKFGLLQTFATPYTSSEYYNDARSYGEGICIDTIRNYICAMSNVEVGTGNVYIARYDLTTGEIIDANYFTIGSGKPGMISYLEDKDKLLVCMTAGSPRDYTINPATMTVDGNISQTTVGLDYDPVYKEYGGVWKESGGYRLTLFTTSYSEKSTINLDQIDISETLQGHSIYNGVLYIVSFTKIYEIDYKNSRSNIIETIPFVAYNSGLEIQQIYASSSGIVALVDDKTHGYILKYNLIAGENLATIPYTKDNNSKKMSNVYPAMATLFAYIVSMEAPYEDTIWCYGGTRFTDLPTLYNGTAYITKVYINKPISNVCYTKIDVELYRVSTNVYRRFAGYIISGSGSITWVEIPTVQTIDAAPTFDTTYGAAASVSYEQIGNIVSYTFIYTPSSNVSAGTTIATGFVLPKVANIPFTILDNSASSDNIKYIYIDTSGNLKTLAALTSGHSYRCNCVYIGNARFD